MGREVQIQRPLVEKGRIRMIPSSDVLEAVWKIVTGLLIGALLGGFGVGLLVRAAWQWLIGRT
jgi:hypothetical protein